MTTTSPIITQTGAVTDMTDTSLRTSIDLIVNTVTRRPADGNQPIERMSEDLLFVAILHERLSAQKPEVAGRLMKELASTYQANLKQKKRQSLSQAAEGILDSMVRSGKIERSRVDSMIRTAFGKAQLDGNATTLARKAVDIVLTTGSDPAQKTALDLVTERALSNERAKAKDLARFDARIEANPTLGAARFNAQRTVLDELFMKTAATTSTAAPPATTTGTPPAAIDPESGPPANVKTWHDIVTGSDDFVYKPESKKDERLMVHIPVFYRERIRGVEIFNSQDQSVEKLVLAEQSPDGRVNFRGTKKGSELEGGGYARLLLIEGTFVDIEIGDFREFLKRTIS